LKEGLKTAARYSIEKACASQLRFFESLRQGNSPADSGLCAVVCRPSYSPNVADVEI
jgi:hypothetical protein